MAEKISKFDENYKPTYSRSSMKLKHQKHEEYLTKAHNNQIAQN